MTYKNLVDNLENIINAHNMIQTYGYGNLSDIEVPDNEEPPNYPYAFVNPVNTTNGRNNFNWTFNLIVMTQVNDGEDNEIAGQDECIQYIQDIVSVFTNTNTNPLLDIITPFDVTPFKERFQDNVVGATAVLTITYAKAIDGCDTPFSSLPSIQSADCPQVLVTDGDFTEHWVNAGGSFTCLNATPASGIYYQRPRIWTQFDTSDIEGTPPWHKAQGTYNYTPPVRPRYIAAKANQYLGSDSNCVLADQNAFGNNFRYTNDIGQQYTEGFNVAAGNTSANKQYCIDHLTGLAFYVQLATTERVDRNWEQAIDYCNTLSYAGFDDWRLADIAELLSVWDYADLGNAFPGIYAPWADPNIRNYGGYFALATREIDTGRYYYNQTNGIWINTVLTTNLLNHVIAVRNHYT